MILTFVAFATLHIHSVWACEDGKVYQHCKNQMDLYQEAVQEAEKEDKALLVMAGYDGCGWCHILSKTLQTGQWQEFVARRFVVVKIALWMPNPTFGEIAGAKEWIPSETGNQVIEYLNTIASNPSEISGYPYLFVVRPQRTPKALGVRADFEVARPKQDYWGYDFVKGHKKLDRALSVLNCRAVLKRGS